MSHQLWDFVRPITEHPESVWRVMEINDKNVTAELRPNELEPKEVRRVIAPQDFFISLDEDEDND